MAFPDSFTLAGRAVHRVGFGAMQLAGPNAFGPPADREEAIAVLRRAVDRGVDHIDTSQYYGPDVVNALIREALHPYPEALTLVSKVGAKRGRRAQWFPADTPADHRKGVEENLATLGIDQIPVVNLRVMDGPERPDATPFDEQLDALIALRQEGLIGAVGLSNVTLDQLDHAIGRTQIACVQNPLNLAAQDGMPVLKACATHGIAFTPFFPLGSAFGATPWVPELPQVQAVAGRLGITPAQVALAWLLQLGPHVLLIPGTSTRSHLDENLAAGSVALDDEALATLATAAPAG